MMKRRYFTDEFKREAVALLAKNGDTGGQVTKPDWAQTQGNIILPCHHPSP
jgi:hypothetical protein